MMHDELAKRIRRMDDEAHYELAQDFAALWGAYCANVCAKLPHERGELRHSPRCRELKEKYGLGGTPA